MYVVWYKGSKGWTNFLKEFEKYNNALYYVEFMAPNGNWAIGFEP